MLNFLTNTINNAALFLETGQSTVELARKTNIVTGPIASILGEICNYIFNFVEANFVSGTLGITIILFTIVVRIILLPFAAHSAKSMAKMKVIQPEIKKIQDKYKGKKDVEAQQRMQREVSELQRKHGANPLQGCLPLLIQMPIIIALFIVLQKSYFYIGTIGGLYTTISDTLLDVNGIGKIFEGLLSGNKAYAKIIKEGFQLDYADNFKHIIFNMTSQDWTNLLVQLPKDTIESLSPLLAKKASIESFLGMNLVEKPNFQSISLTIPVISGLTTFLSSWLMNKAQGSAAMDAQAKMQQRMMLYTMPIMMGAMAFSLPAGIGVYWIMGNIFQIGQQYVFNKIYDPNKTVDSSKEDK